jgi:hypothetical protein
MNDELITLMTSLSDLMDEESALLLRGAWPPRNEALADAKIRLTGALEATLAERGRTDPAWLDAVPADSPLGLAIDQLRCSALDNAGLLSRQIDLSQELLAEIAREAGRIGGGRQQTYQRGGQLHQRSGPTPVTLNTRL